LRILNCYTNPLGWKDRLKERGAIKTPSIEASLIVNLCKDVRNLDDLFSLIIALGKGSYDVAAFETIVEILNIYVIITPYMLRMDELEDAKEALKDLPSRLCATFENLQVGRCKTYGMILMEDEQEKYQSHFSQYIKAGVDPENIEELYKKPFVLIQPQRKLEKQPPNEHKRFNLKKLTYDERKEKLIERLNAPSAAAGGADDE
ncbi:Ribosomal protein L5 eukaryotic/L18 archaeal, partial [Cynara cardunculus var. scolymus]